MDDERARASIPATAEQPDMPDAADTPDIPDAPAGAGDIGTPGDDATTPDEAVDEAVTGTFVAVSRGHGGPRRRRRGRRVAVTLGALAGLLGIVSALLLAAHPASWGFFAFGALPTATATRTVEPTWTPPPTLTPEPVWTATALPTATATAPGKGGGGPPVQPPPATPLDLGCGAGASQPPSYAVYGGPGAPRAVALTFDDGPNPGATGNILSILEQKHAPGTFFVVGYYAQQYPGFLQRMAADGFPIGLHTWSHPAMTQLSPSDRAWQLAATAAAIHRALGAGYCIPFWRPPYGDYNGAVLAQARDAGLTTIIWNDDPADWSMPGVQTIVSRVLAQAKPGSIILLHDGPSFRQQTVAALPAIIDGLRQRGLTPVTLPDLLRGGPPPPPPPTATPVPTPTFTATPSPTATATATATPTPVPTDTPTPTPTPTPVPTDTPTPVPTDTPTG